MMIEQAAEAAAADKCSIEVVASMPECCPQYVAALRSCHDRGV